MRCQCCNRVLNDFESTRRSKSTGDFLDMCNKCVKESGPIAVVVRSDLEPFEKPEDDDADT